MCNRLVKVLGPLTCGLLVAMSAWPVRGQSETAGSIPGPLSLDPAKFSETQARAKMDEVEAQLFLGWMYDDGVGAPRSSADATNWWLKAADQGLATAELAIGSYYAYPAGSVPSGEAFRWWVETSERLHNSLDLTNASGTATNRDSDYSETAEAFRGALNKGGVLAVGNLGWKNLTNKNKEAAVQLWRQAGVQSAIDRSRAEKAGRQDLILQAGRDSARASIGIWAVSNMRKLTTKSGGYVMGAVVDVFPDGIRYIGEDGIPCSLLRTEDASQEVREEFHLSVPGAQRYQREQHEQEMRRLEESRGPKCGTGFFVSDDGYILTCDHVVSRAGSVEVRTASRQVLSAVIMTEDAANDLALLKVSKGSGLLPCLPLGSASEMREGTDVLTVGFPDPLLQGTEPTTTYGQINKLSGIGDDPTHFQVQVPIQPGNSGGALVNSHGNVIGIVGSKLNERLALLVTGQLPQNVNYAIKSGYAIELMMSARVKLKEAYAGEERKREDVTAEVIQATVWVRAH